jgi:hypothetical protein
MVGGSGASCAARGEEAGCSATCERRLSSVILLPPCGVVGRGGQNNFQPWIKKGKKKTKRGGGRRGK